MSNIKIRSDAQGKFRPQRIVELKDSEKVRAYVHPVRITILSMLVKEKRTVSDVARELEVHPANITHHFKLLEKNGLIRLVEKRDIGQTVEKYYRAGAYSYVVKLDNESTSNKKALALSILRDDLAAAVGAVRDDDTRPTIALLKTARIKDKDAILFANRLKKLVDDFAARDSEKGTPFNINVSLYPGDAVFTSGKEIHIG
jgi:DNA-binding transcriptional ArsR family regulator